MIKFLNINNNMILYDKNNVYTDLEPEVFLFYVVFSSILQNKITNRNINYI